METSGCGPAAQQNLGCGGDEIRLGDLKIFYDFIILTQKYLQKDPSNFKNII